MDSLVRKDLTRSIGIANVNGQQFMDVIGCAQIQPATVSVIHIPNRTQDRFCGFIFVEIRS